MMHGGGTEHSVCAAPGLHWLAWVSQQRKDEEVMGEGGAARRPRQEASVGLVDKTGAIVLLTHPSV